MKCLYIYYTGYIRNLIQETMELYVHGGSTVIAYTAPEPLCSGYARPEKGSAIRGHKSRYNWF